MDEEQLKIYAEPITSLYYVRTKLPEDILEKIKIICEENTIKKDKYVIEKINVLISEGGMKEAYIIY
jgi:hypothetical protein